MSVKAFDEVFEDKTKYGTKVKTDKYHQSGKHLIIDQGQAPIAGYTDLEQGLFEDVPAIIFGDHTRVIKYVDVPFFLGADGVKVLRSKYEDANYRYLYYALKSVRIPDTGYNRHFKWLKETQINYPDAGLQEEIVRILDGISEVIDKRQQQLSTLDNLIKARFVEMFGNEMNDGIPLKDCCIDVRGGGTPSMQHPEYYGGDVPFIKSGDVRGDTVSSGALWLTEQALSETTAKYVPKGSVLVVNRSASLLREFRAAIAIQPVVINQDIKAFIPRKEFTSEYLLWAIKIQTQLLLTKVTTVLTSHIDLKDLLDLRIVPASIERQKDFSIFINQVDKSKVAVQKALNEAQVLFDSLMQQYFG